jgi:carboxyl-terminal processing protease
MVETALHAWSHAAVTFRDRVVTLLLTIALAAATLLSPALAPSAAAQTAPLPSSVAAATAAALKPADAAAAETIHQGYDLLLDRFVQQLEPKALLNAAYDAIVKGLADSGVQVKNQTPPSTEVDRERAWAAFETRLAELLKDTAPPESFNLAGTALTAMASSVDEGHTAYYSPDLYREFLAQLRGDVRYGGIGLRPRRPGVTVAEVFPGSPAEQAGIATGDLILAVDGQTVEGKTLEQVALLIRGPEGTSVRLDIDRPRSGEKLMLTIVRASIKVEFIRTEMIQDSVAYIQLRSFVDPNVVDKFEEFLDRLPATNARGLVIDLRGNGGGRIDLGVRLLNRFIASGPLLDQVDRNGQHRVISASGPGWANPLPLVVLVDDGTASMGEIFAAALRERGLARVMGRTTAGSVAAAQVYPLTDGSALQVTIFEIYSGRGARLNRVGLTPDDLYDTAPEDLERGRDIPLEAAVQYVWAVSDSTRAQAGG